MALAKALDELYAELSAEDQRNGEVGPGSFVYSFYDFGLASIREALDEVPLRHTHQLSSSAQPDPKPERRR